MFYYYSLLVEYPTLKRISNRYYLLLEICSFTLHIKIVLLHKSPEILNAWTLLTRFCKYYSLLWRKFRLIFWTIKPLLNFNKQLTFRWPFSVSFPWMNWNKIKNVRQNLRFENHFLLRWTGKCHLHKLFTPFLRKIFWKILFSLFLEAIWLSISSKSSDNSAASWSDCDPFFHEDTSSFVRYLSYSPGIILVYPNIACLLSSKETLVQKTCWAISVPLLRAAKVPFMKHFLFRCSLKGVISSV